MSLSRETILSQQDLKSETVEVPEWGGSVKVKGLTAFQKASFDRSHEFDSSGKITPESAATYYVRMLILCAVDDDGKPLFLPADSILLQEKSSSAVERLVAAVRRVNGDAGEAEKNSEATT